MVGIMAYGAYVPFHRLQRKALNEAHGKPGGKGERSVANYDEDSVSMAVEAAWNALWKYDTKQVGTVYLGTTTNPYAEKASSTTIAAALDMPPQVRTADFGDSLRAGSSALLAALDAAVSTGKPALALAGDCRIGGAGGGNESSFGDGAAAFLFGTGDLVARVLATASVANEIVDNFRRHEDVMVRNWEERFGIVQGVNRAIPAAVKQALQQAGLKGEQVDRFVCASPSSKATQAVAKMCGIRPEAIEDALEATVGQAGAAHGPMMLTGALEKAKAGDKILFVSYAEGADALLLEATPGIDAWRPKRHLSDLIERKRNDIRYTDYLRWRNLLDFEPPRRPEMKRPAATAMFRNYHQNLGLYGSRCTACGALSYPKQRVCWKCRAKDKTTDYSFRTAKGKIRTFSADHLAYTPAPPELLVVIDFEEGGRLMCNMADVDLKNVKVGEPVEMTFRRLYEAGGIFNYAWKAKAAG
ncbi:MAG: hydroxymethylglutaryl-CoA synthase family protein [Deltaproteobacteria bacterium]|nr:hydroxymethylglutaryl-CoA synthase family protein [Deltaproteobacteria bacterium]